MTGMAGKVLYVGALVMLRLYKTNCGRKCGLRRARRAAMTMRCC